MKIVFVSTLYPAFASEPNKVATRALHNIIKYWADEAVVMVYVPIMRSRNARPGKFEIDNVVVKPIKYNYLSWIITLIKMSIDIYYGFGKPDCIIGHYSVSIRFASCLARLFNSKLVIGIHSTDVIRINAGRYNFYKKYLEAANLIACRSNSIRNDLNNYTSNHFKDKCFLALSGIDGGLIVDYNIFLEKLKRSDGVYKFCTASRLIKLKNIDVTLHALSRIGASWTFDIVGDGEERDNLEKLCLKLNIQDRVKFHGYKAQEEVFSVFRKSDVMIMPSKPETFGLSYIEAMAFGCVVIGTKGCGIDGVVENLVDGYLVEARDIQDLQVAIEDYINKDVEGKEQMIKKIYSKIKSFDERKLSLSYLHKVKSI